MKFKFSHIVLVVMAMTFTANSFALTVSKGVAEASYSGFFGPSAESKREAIAKAELNALKRFVAGESRSKVKLFNQKKDEINSQLEDIVLSKKIIDEEVDKKAKTIRVTIKAEINVELLNAIIAGDETDGSVEGEYISFVFVAREQESVKSFKARQTVVMRKNRSAEGAELEDISDAGVEYNAGESTTTSMSKGGSVNYKNDEIHYRATTSNDINVAMGNVFSDAGFEVVEAVYIEDETSGLLNVEDFKKDYATGDDVNRSTLKNAVKGLRKIDIPYFAMGTLDVDAPHIDPNTGLVKVYVTVTGQINSLKSRFPKRVASSGPTQFAGEGPSASVAKRNALLLASKEVAVELTEQLRNKKIQ
jgi:hypothetical protein